MPASIRLPALSAVAFLGLGVALSAVAGPTAPKAAPAASPLKKPVARPFLLKKGGIHPAIAGVRKQLSVPGVAFPHRDGTMLDPVLSSPNFSMNSVTVNVVFHGGTWSDADKTNLTRAVQSILTSSYLSGLVQANYGTDGKATFGVSLSSNADLTLDGTIPGSTLRYPTLASMEKFLQNTTVGNTDNRINVIVNDPASSVGLIGFNNWLKNNASDVYVATAQGAGGSVDKDFFTKIFSHELVEAMTSGVGVTDPKPYNLGSHVPDPNNPGKTREFSQVCDNEPEAEGGGYYAQVTGTFPNGGAAAPMSNVVQAYWSQVDGTFIVAGGSILPVALAKPAPAPKAPAKPHRRPPG